MLRSVAHNKVCSRSFSSSTSLLASSSTAHWQSRGSIKKNLKRSESKYTPQPVPTTVKAVLTQTKNRRDVPSTDSNPADTKWLLSPYTLAGRLRGLCDKGAMDDAVDMLKNAPLDAQNIKVWNAMITSAFKAHRYKLAWELFVDCKRRGFVPNLRTYSSMMSGYCRIEDWSQYSKQLDHVHLLYEQYSPYLTGKGIHADDDPTEVLFPVALYITVLGRAGLFQKAFDVFHELPTEGPHAAGALIYGSLLDALAKRRSHLDTNDSDSESRKAIALEAKYVWRRMLRSMEKDPSFVMNERILSSLIKILSLAGPSPSGDPDFAFDIIRDHFGLLGPDDALLKTRKQKFAHTQTIPLEHHSLLTVLQYANTVRKPEYCIHYAEQIMANAKRGGIQLFVYPHAMETLYAHNALALAGDKTQATKAARMLGWVFQREGSRPSCRPPRKVYSLAWRICATCGDFAAAKRVFYMATGYAADEGAKYKQSWMVNKGGELSVSEWLWTFRAAMASGDTAAEDMGLCVEMLDAFGEDVVKAWKEVGATRGELDLQGIRTTFKAGLSEHQRLAAIVVKADTSKAGKEVAQVVRTAAQGFLAKVGGLLASARKGVSTDSDGHTKEPEASRTVVEVKESTDKPRTGARRRLPMPN